MRQTSEQIDLGILDVAAGIFATHGYGHTSVQQVADAVGYSKAGLLHRFGSKEALYRAVVAEGSRVADGVIDEVTALPEGADRSREQLEVLSRHVLRRTGMVRLLISSFEPTNEDPMNEEVRNLGIRVLSTLAPVQAGPVDNLRVVLALQLLVNASLAQLAMTPLDVALPENELIQLMVDLAMQVLPESTVLAPANGAARRKRR